MVEGFNVKMVFQAVRHHDLQSSGLQNVLASRSCREYGI